MSQFTAKDIERFWSKVAISNNVLECWEWQRCKFKNGYGKFGLGGRKGGVVYAHRFAWELANEAIPGGLFVLHSCDNPACVNPHHLFLGTQQNNVEDMLNKQRNKKPPIGKGESNPNHKLTEFQVAYIRKNYVRGTNSARILADELKVGISTIRRVVNHESWKETHNE